MMIFAFYLSFWIFIGIFILFLESPYDEGHEALGYMLFYASYIVIPYLIITLLLTAFHKKHRVFYSWIALLILLPIVSMFLMVLLINLVN